MVKTIIWPLLRLTFFTVLVKAVFLWLEQSHQIYVDRKLAVMIEAAESIAVQAPVWIGYALVGGIGFLAMTVWEIAKYRGWFPWQSAKISTSRVLPHEQEGPVYWSLSETLSWVAFGEAITAKGWTKKCISDGLLVRPQEETNSFNKAEHLLFEALRGEKICALGKKNESQQYEEIPPEYFLSDVSCAILHNQIDVNPENIGARSKWDGPKWCDVRFKRETVLLLWPPGKEGKVELDELLVRDWNLSQAYDYWAATTNERGEFGAELEQAASECVITIWGKRNYLNDAIFEPIPPNHWTRSRIEIHSVIFSSSLGVEEEYILENSTTKPRNVHDSSLEQYWCLCVTSSEVKKLWPVANT